MTTATATPAVRLVSNDLVLERARQEALPTGTDRLPTMRNRLARGKTAARLVTILVVANERKDATVAKMFRDKLVTEFNFEAGFKLADVYTVAKSRRLPENKLYLAVTGTDTAEPVIADESVQVESTEA